jgi:hypothetical protein
VRQISPVRVAGAVFVALALAFGLGAFTLGFRAEGVPGPGLLPLLASAVLLPIGVRLLVTPGVVGETSPFAAAPLSLLAVLAVHALLLPRLGFVAPTLVVLVVWARVFHGRSLVAALALAVLLTSGVVVLFNALLGIRMPLWPGSA